MQNQLYFVGLKAFIRNSEGKILILEGYYPNEATGLWSLPGRRIDSNEDNTPLNEILLREVHEECGAIDITIGELFTAWRFNSPKGPIVLLGFCCAYIDGTVTLSDEHTKYRWIGKDELDQQQFVHGYREAIEQYFKTR